MKKSDSRKILGLFEPSTSLFSPKKLILPIILTAIIILAIILLLINNISNNETTDINFNSISSSSTVSIEDSPVTITDIKQKETSQNIEEVPKSAKPIEPSGNTNKELNHSKASFSSAKPEVVGLFESKIALLTTGYYVTADSLDSQSIKGLGFNGTITREGVSLTINDFSEAEKYVNKFIVKYTGKEYTIANTTSSITITKNNSEYVIVEK